MALALADFFGDFGRADVTLTIEDALCAVGAGHVWDGVCLDLGFPGRSGLEVLEQLRTHDTAVPVMVLTGRVNPELINRVNSLGAEYI